MCIFVGLNFFLSCVFFCFLLFSPHDWLTELEQLVFRPYLPPCALLTHQIVRDKANMPWDRFNKTFTHNLVLQANLKREALTRLKNNVLESIGKAAWLTQKGERIIVPFRRCFVFKFGACRDWWNCRDRQNAGIHRGIPLADSGYRG